MLIRLLALTLLAPLVLLAACGDDDDNAKTNTPKPAAATTAAGGGETTSAKEITINAADFSFNPATITAAPGQKVKITLKNDGQAKHSFTVGSNDVTEAEGGQQGTGEFTVQAGDTEFHCKYHATQMKGTISVSGSGASNPSATAAPGGGFGY